MRLGLVTYNLARDWDLPTLIRNCEETGFEAVELRTTHAHGVEPELDAAGRDRARELFAGASVRLLSLGTTCEFHSPDPAIVQENVEICREFHGSKQISCRQKLSCPHSSLALISR